MTYNKKTKPLYHTQNIETNYTQMSN
ncbi:hypothetical protein F383_34454 [Gossypium arboreum]|uniref:Uncharacterized protein n=1 Tax=Gossypium arboreum TaxID=29729 RepID=A0A0B0N6R2_GOSAR|nr:hypothetical protein F383_34454 [Gossypium arboreum]